MDSGEEIVLVEIKKNLKLKVTLSNRSQRYAQLKYWAEISLSTKNFDFLNYLGELVVEKCIVYVFFLSVKMGDIYGRQSETHFFFLYEFYQ